MEPIMTWLFLQCFSSQDSGHKAFTLKQTSGNNSSFQLDPNIMKIKCVRFSIIRRNVDGVDGNIELINQTFILQGGYDGSWYGCL